MKGEPVLDGRSGGYRLKVNGLKDGISEDLLREKFSAHGSVKEVFIRSNGGQEPMVFVTMETAEDATKAGNELNDT